MRSETLRGGQRVRVDAPGSELHGKVLIVMAPTPYFVASSKAVQCFDPDTGYVWPFRAAQLNQVGGDIPNLVEQ